MLPIAFPPIDSRCNGNEIWDNIGYNAAPPQENKNVMNCFTRTYNNLVRKDCTSVINYSKQHSSNVANYFSTHEISLRFATVNNHLSVAETGNTGHHGETGFVTVKLELPERADSSTSPWH